MTHERDFKAYYSISTKAVLGTAGDMAGGLHYEGEYFSLCLSSAKRSVVSLRKQANDLDGAIARFEATSSEDDQEGE